MIGKEYWCINKLLGWCYFDDCLFVFGMVVFVYSCVVMMMVQIFCYIWIEVGGGDWCLMLYDDEGCIFFILKDELQIGGWSWLLC